VQSTVSRRGPPVCAVFRLAQGPSLSSLAAAAAAASVAAEHRQRGAGPWGACSKASVQDQGI